ncbi:MAG: 16S rRNA (uracil(1498)-N(3))-methyltransferase [Candidatus Margulisiibacteriota bacterium]|nr:16S rRNA (uracil(1498)-N(3))-methyltransferase [Candidatus Margulisiibacteriota bacterium]
MRRFFIDKESICGPTVHIKGGDYNHIKNVLRYKPEDTIYLIDSLGQRHTASIKEITNHSLVCQIEKTERPARAKGPIVTIAQAIPKGKKMDLIVQKATELGAANIIPMTTERTIVKLDGKEEKKLSHWQKIAKESSQQCGRDFIPSTEKIQSFDEVIAQAKEYDLSIIPWECEENAGLKSLLQEGKPRSLFSVLFVIGPEGGFSVSEVEKARQAGIMPVSLGKRILRTETVAMAVLAMLIYEYEL